MANSAILQFLDEPYRDIDRFYFLPGVSEGP
jgi:hypothetical protein